jgi:hypothetical protein
MPQGQAFCHGNGDDHCCWLAGQVCPFLRDDGWSSPESRRFVCTLREELGDWDLVHSDPRYLATVEPLWRASGDVMNWIWDEGVRCGNWPGAIMDIKVRGNAPQWQKDAKADALATYQRLANDPEAKEPNWSCYGGRRPFVDGVAVNWPSTGGG